MERTCADRDSGPGQAHTHGPDSQQEMQTSALQPQGSEFCPHPDAAGCSQATGQSYSSPTSEVTGRVCGDLLLQRQETPPIPVTQHPL